MEELEALQRRLDELSVAYETIFNKLAGHDTDMAIKSMPLPYKHSDMSHQENRFDETNISMKLVAFLNAKHYMVFAGKKGQIHGHSWQFQADVDVKKNDDSFIKFEDVDKNLNVMLVPYQRMVLNDVPPFDQIEPLTENIAVYFFNTMYDDLESNHVHLNKLTVWENPTKGIEITYKIDQFFSTNDLAPVISAKSLSLHTAQEQAAAAKENTSQGEQLSESSETISSQIDNSCNFADSLGDNSENDSKTKSRSLTDFIKKSLSNEENRFSKIEKNDQNPWWHILVAALIIVGVSIGAYWDILAAPVNHVYPWGADTWGHLYKAEYLYKEMLKGNYFPQFTPDWYNGSQLFRYWAPLPYYFLAGLRFFTSNIFAASNCFIFICALFSGLFWLIARKYLGLWPACMAGLVWVIWPDNIKIAFAEGNLPRALTTAILPLAFWCFFKVVTPHHKRKYWHIICTIICINILVLSHAMMSAIYCICFMVFAIILWMLENTSFRHVIRGFASLVVGLAISSWWLLPSLKGGLTGMSDEAAGAPVKFASFTSSFNPLSRFVDPSAHYWGISLLLVAFLTILFWQHKKGWAKSLFYCGLIFMLLTFPSFSWLQRLLPLNHILWPLRFSTFTCFAFIAFAFAFDKRDLTFLKSKKIRVGLLVVIIFIAFMADGYYSCKNMVRTAEKPDAIYQCADELKNKNDWRVATLDLSYLESSPTYLFSSYSNREQIFGWAWQGATTAQNIMLLNSAFEYSLYPYVVRELNHLGGTTLVVHDQLVKNPEAFQRLISQYGYKKDKKIEDISIWKKSTRPYAFISKRNCLAIGEYASVFAMLFPEVEIGRSKMIDDYSQGELNSYDTVILSGSNWYSKSKAEKMIVNYANQGGRAIVDFTGFPLDVLARQPQFLGVYGEPIIIDKQLILKSFDQTVNLRPFAKDYSSWRTYIPQGLDKTLASCSHYSDEASLWGYKIVNGSKVWFMGANLAYHAVLTADPSAISLLKQFTGLSDKYIPEQTLTYDEYLVTDNGYKITYSLDKSTDAVIPIANLDGLEAKIDGKVVNKGQSENLISMRLPAGHHVIDVVLNRPKASDQGMFLSFIGLLMCVLWVGIGYKQDRKKLNLGINA